MSEGVKKSSGQQILKGKSIMETPPRRVITTKCVIVSYTGIGLAELSPHSNHHPQNTTLTLA
jgi:hypothetical protein